MNLALNLLEVPLLPNASCLGRWQEFDFTVEDGNPSADANALRICAGCPELSRCAAWFDALPAVKKPRGVVAGRVHRPRKRKSKAIA